MNEIEKLYENARIKMQHLLDVNTNQFVDKYPLFTAEKQIEIVKFLLNKSVYYDTYGDREYWFHISDEIENSKYRDFDRYGNEITGQGTGPVTIQVDGQEVDGVIALGYQGDTWGLETKNLLKVGNKFEV